MPRNIDDLTEKSWPPTGPIGAVCISAKPSISKVKKTPNIELLWESLDGEFQWTDNIYCTVKALQRLAITAKNVCDFNGELPDSDEEAMSELTNFILQSIVGKRAIVTIEERSEIYIPETGPDLGRKVEKKKKVVAFRGYEKWVEGQTPIKTPENSEEKKDDSDNLPF